MRALVLTASVLAAGAILVASTGPPAKADTEFPYCTSGGPVTENMCDFYTLQQCREFVAGVGGTCVVNPRFAPNYNVIRYQHHNGRQPQPAAAYHQRYYGPTGRMPGPY